MLISEMLTPMPLRKKKIDEKRKKGNEDKMWAWLVASIQSFFV